MNTYTKNLLASVTFFSLTVSPLIASETLEGDWKTKAFIISDDSIDLNDWMIQGHMGASSWLKENAIKEGTTAQLGYDSDDLDVDSEEYKRMLEWGTTATMGSYSVSELTPDLIAFREDDKSIIAQSSPVTDTNPTLKDHKDDRVKQKGYDVIKKRREALAYSMMESSSGNHFDFDTPEIATNGEKEVEKYERMKLITQQPLLTNEADQRLTHNIIAKQKEIRQAKAFMSLYEKNESIKKAREAVEENQKTLTKDITRAKDSFADRIANAAKNFEEDLGISTSEWGQSQDGHRFEGN